MATYRVLPNRTHGRFDQYGPGSLVEMTPEEAGPFLGYKVEAVAEEAPIVFDVASLSVAAVLQAVAAGDIAADAALTQERAGKNRVTLIAQLETLINGAVGE